MSKSIQVFFGGIVAAVVGLFLLGHVPGLQDVLLPRDKPDVQLISKPDNGGPLTPDAVRLMDADVIDARVELTTQPDSSIWTFAEVKINAEPHDGGQIEWSQIAGKAHRLAMKMLPSDRQGRLMLRFISKKQDGVEWAAIVIDTHTLPQDWRKLSFLELFARSQPMAETRQSSQWLCEFYGKYTSARPINDNWRAGCQ